MDWRCCLPCRVDHNAWGSAKSHLAIKFSCTVNRFVGQQHIIQLVRRMLNMIGFRYNNVAVVLMVTIRFRFVSI